MPKQKTNLSITKRVLLDYIRFRTNNNFTFHEGNEYIAKALDLMPSSAKIFVNELVRDGYLYKEVDKKGRRILSYTQKEYVPLFEDMRNVEKKVLKEDRDNALRDNQYLQQQVENETAHAEQLLSQNTELTLSNEQLTYRVKELEKKIQVLEEKCQKYENRLGKIENLFYNNGTSKEQLERLIQMSSITI